MDLRQFTSSGQLSASELQRQREFFQSNAPAFLAERYRLRVADPGSLVFDGHGELINPCHGLDCRACGGTLHRVQMHGRGVLTFCAGCEYAETLMGEPGSGAALSCECGAEKLSVAVRLEYPGDLFGMGARGHEPEFFTWVTLFAECPSCGATRQLADAESG